MIAVITVYTHCLILWKIVKTSLLNITCIIQNKRGIDVNLVFTKKQKNQFLTLEWHYITLEGDEILRIYGNRCNIEVIFKVSKDLRA